MTKRPKTDTSVGPWAKEKLDSLRQYLEYYTRRLKNQKWCRGLYFVDAFAGPGLSPLRQNDPSTSEVNDLFASLEATNVDADEIEYVKGSPRVALEIKNPFSHYIFIEKDAERRRELNGLKDEFSDGRDIEVVAGDANAEIEKLIARSIDWRSHKGVVFLDPFGMQVAWSTIEKLARTRGIEVIINFPFGMAINRLLTTTGDIPQAWQDRLDATFGSKNGAAWSMRSHPISWV